MSLLVALLLLAATPSPEELCKRAASLDAAEAKVRGRYTYREEHTDKDLDKAGAVTGTRSKTFDCIFLEGSLYRKLIAEDNHPLDPKTQARVDAEMSKERERRRRGPRCMSFSRTLDLAETAEIPNYFDLKVSGEESLDGRAVWVLQADPKAQTPSLPYAKDNAGVKLTLWIDKESGAVLARETTVLKKTNSFEPGSVIRDHWTRINDECWQVDRIEMKISLNVYKMIHVKAESVSVFSDFKKFDVESSITYRE